MSLLRMQPLLLPGTRVVRRDAHHLQVGLDPATRVVLPDTPALRRLESGEALRRDPALAARLGPLVLPDDRPLRAALAPASSYAEARAWSRHSLASLAREGRAGTQALERRGSCLVLVHTAPGARHRPVGLDTLVDALAEDLRLLCRRSGLQVGTGPSEPSPDRAVVRVLLAVGEPDRALVDGWSEPHLVLRFVEGRALVGPFVEPGAGPCLRCADAHLAQQDPAWPLLLEQHVRRGGPDRADGIPEPLDAALASVALGWAARDLARHAEGGVPQTLGRTLRIDPELVAVTSQDWPWRPDCGCADEMPGSGTTHQAEWSHG